VGARVADRGGHRARPRARRDRGEQRWEHDHVHADAGAHDVGPPDHHDDGADYDDGNDADDHDHHRDHDDHDDDEWQRRHRCPLTLRDSPGA
jgi:hypothetical protein